MIILLDFVLLFTLPWLMAGVIKKVKAFFARRKGPSLFQFGYDLRKLLRKGEIISLLAVNPLASCLALGSVFAAFLLIPQPDGRAILSFLPFDFIFFAYLLGLSRFFSVVASMDAGSSFEGMGCSRELLFSLTAEMALMLTFVALAFYTGGRNFAEIIARLGVIEGAWAPVALASGILFILMLVECCRVPVDDPETHLELTMIHEVMVLDQSGPDLGYLTYTAMTKMYLFSSLIAAMALSPWAGTNFYFLAFLGVLLLVALVTGLLEALHARLRMVHVKQFILFAVSLAGLLLFLVLMQKGGVK